MLSIKTERTTLKTILTLLESQCKYLNKITNKIDISEAKENKFIERSNTNKRAHFKHGTHLKYDALTAIKGCILCKGNYLLYGCNGFLKVSPS